MEALTRLVTESLARHGLDRPVDPRRLQWSRWFPCDSPHSLLVVPSKPGVFAIAEEITDLGNSREPLGGAALQRCDSAPPGTAALAAEAARHMLAVLLFCEDDDMAFVLDRMFTRANPMRDRLASGRCFLRFVVIHDQAQRRSICSALNQWMISSAGKATGFTADFASSLELTPSADGVAQTPLPVQADAGTVPLFGGMPTQSLAPASALVASPQIDSGAASNIHCPPPFPSGF